MHFSQEDLADRWNARYGIGQDVNYSLRIGDRKTQHSVTICAAFIRNGYAVVKLAAVPTYIRIDALEATDAR